MVKLEKMPRIKYIIIIYMFILKQGFQISCNMYCVFSTYYGWLGFLAANNCTVKNKIKFNIVVLYVNTVYHKI